MKRFALKGASKESGKRRLTSVTHCMTLLQALLSGEKLDRKKAAALLGCAAPTADRYLRVLKSFPGVTTQREGGRLVFRAQRASTVPEVTLAEQIARCIGASLAPLFQGSPYAEALRALSTNAADSSRFKAEWFKDADRKFYFHRRGGEPALEDRDGPLEDLIDALLKHQEVVLRYQPFVGPARRLRMKPYTLLLHEHQLYVLGRTSKGLKFVRLSRIEDVEQVGHFKYPTRAEYDPTVVLRDSIGVFLQAQDYPVAQVVLRFSRRWTHFLRSHRFHESQQVRPERGGVLVTLQVRCCPELEKFVLGFGEEVEVLKPDALRERIAELAQQLAALYAPQRTA